MHSLLESTPRLHVSANIGSIVVVVVESLFSFDQSNYFVKTDTKTDKHTNTS